MFRKFCRAVGLRAATALTLALSVTSAGADGSRGSLKDRGPTPFTWAGFYVGANIGYGWAAPTSDVSPQPDPASFGASPFSVDMSPKGPVSSLNGPSPDAVCARLTSSWLASPGSNAF
jgi:hypothetical protein